MLLLLTLFNIGSEAKLSDRYTKQKPLVILCDWDMPPYEYLDDQGQPAGYTMEMLNLILGFRAAEDRLDYRTKLYAGAHGLPIVYHRVELLSAEGGDAGQQPAHSFAI